MLNHGNCKIKYLAPVIFLVWHGFALCQNYILNTYKRCDSCDFKQIATVFVDLENSAITDEIIISNYGDIVNNIPVKIGNNRHSYLINAILQGCYCANTSMGKRKTRIVVIDGESHQIRISYDDTTLFIYHFENRNSNRIFITAGSELSNRDSLFGEYSLGKNWRFSELRRYPVNFNANYYGRIGRFWPLEGIDTLLNIFSNIQDDYLYLIKADAQRRVILDTINAGNSYTEAIIYTVKDTTLYLFHLNCERHAGLSSDKDYGENWIYSRVTIYDAHSMNPIDSVRIPDYPHGDYIVNEHGVADVIGPFIVYYFFYQESLEVNSPAMLFIFDTRTNETTWLRVGWR